MDRIKNPFSPGAGTPPPELAGREDVLEQARVLLGRVKHARSEKSILLTGLRGVGKTVLLNEIERLAAADDYNTVLIEVHENKSLGILLIPHLRKLLFELDRVAGAGEMVRRGLGVLRSFASTLKITVDNVEFGLDIDPETGAADSGDIEVDLPNLFIAVAQAAKERNASVAILIDEIQYFEKKELSALIMAMHKMQQLQLPLVLIGAGLPILPGLAGDSKSYAERLFSFPDIGALSEQDAKKALQDPVEEYQVTIEEKALDELFRLTHGYPYFLQEWGYQVWNHAESSPIDLRTVKAATELVIARLDSNFFRVRFDRLTPKEKQILRAMAELGAGPHRTSEVATLLGIQPSGLSPIRDKLIKKGMVYSPEHGYMAFTVPLFDEFMLRAMPEFNADE